MNSDKEQVAITVPASPPSSSAPEQSPTASQQPSRPTSEYDHLTQDDAQNLSMLNANSGSAPNVQLGQGQPPPPQQEHEQQV